MTLAHDHWLKVLCRIAEAPTGDLRRLAEIAEADPRTFYIGTNLNGADIRGSDLSGMMFTEVDLKKLQYDDRTIIDMVESPIRKNDQSSNIANNNIRIALMASGRDYKSMPRLLNIAQGPPLLVFGPADKEEFYNRARETDDLPIVVLDYSYNNGLEKFANIPAQSLLILNITKPLWQTKSLTQTVDDLSRRFERVVVVASHIPSSHTRPPTMSGTVLSLIGLISGNPKLLTLLDFTHSKKAKVYFRSIGVGNCEPKTVWSRVFASVMHQGLLGSKVIVIGNLSDRAHWKLFFPGSDVLHENAPLNILGNQAHIFVELQQEASQNEARVYETGVARLLESNGWILEYDRIHRNKSVRIIGAGAAYDLDIKLRFVGDSLRKNDDDVFADLNSINTMRIVVSEVVDPWQIVHALRSRSFLVVSVVDIVNFDAQSPTQWLLIASQLQRMGKIGDRGARTAYIAFIIRQCIRNMQAADMKDGWFLDEIMSGDFSHRFELRCSKFKWAEGALICRIKINPVEPNLSSSPSLPNLIMTIRTDGPTLDLVSHKVI